MFLGRDWLSTALVKRLWGCSDVWLNATGEEIARVAVEHLSLKILQFSQTRATAHQVSSWQ